MFGSKLEFSSLLFTAVFFYHYSDCFIELVERSGRGRYRKNKKNSLYCQSYGKIKNNII